jgi:hypothetical protein
MDALGNLGNNLGIMPNLLKVIIGTVNHLHKQKGPRIPYLWNART